MDVQIGKGITMPVAFDTMPQNAKDHIIYIGLRNVLMDAHASITKDEYPDPAAMTDAARAVADKKLAALMAGDVRVQSTREGDPVRAEAVRLATDAIKSALRKAGKKLADFDPKALRAKAQELVASKPEYTEKAKARVAEMRAIESVDISGL